ncbi:MAG: YhcB family protein [Congregibacter sp.]
MNTGMEEVIFAAAAAAVVGMLIGFLTGRRASPDVQQTRELERQLEEAKVTQERYANQVNTHFADTASKLTMLTATYRDVYEHLANGATDLCDKEAAQGFTALAAPATSADDIPIDSDSVMVEAPKDYAPKLSSDDPGVLNERFGLEGQNVPPEETAKRVE